MLNSLKNLTVLRYLLNDNVFSLFAEYAEGDSEKFAEFVSSFYNRKKFTETGLNFAQYVENLIITDENLVSKALAGGNVCEQMAANALLRDIDIIISAVNNADAHNYYACEHKRFKSAEEAFSLMKRVYPVYGYGQYMLSHAFGYENGKLVPSSAYGADGPLPSLKKLKDYATEKRLIENNLINFINGLPCSNMLLYGDRGTGKSSTVHAMIAEHFKDGLRLIELDSRQLSDIPAVRRLVADSPLKFIIFVDDLSLNEGDEKLSSLKACIEGTAAVSKNTIVVATSNRRHIVKENFSDRDNAVHANDLMQEQLSLSDRFGLTVMFSSTGKAEYLSIVKQLAADEKLELSVDELCALAERWAIMKGGRSPRRARQFIDLASAAQVRAVPIEF